MQFAPSAWASKALVVLASLGAVTAHGPSLPVQVNVLESFGFPSWAENLAIRANGQILVARLDTPELLQVDPTGVLAPITVATWNASYYYGALGISETTPDVFYINIAAPVDGNFVKTSGIPAVYKVDLNTFKTTSTGEITSNATVSLLTELPDADFINGMTTLDDEHIYVADVYNGWVYLVDVTTGEYSIAIDDPKMKFPADAATNLGVNGLKIWGPYLYWTNTANGTLNKIEINSKGLPIGKSSIVTANVPRADDFIIKSDGTIFIAQNQFDELSVLEPGSSTATVIAGSPISTTLAGVSAGKFGRLPWDCNRLYLTTSGGQCPFLSFCFSRSGRQANIELALALPINGSVVVGGTVSWIDTTYF